MTTVVDDKVNQLKKMEGEMRDLFSGKQASLSQFNENTLVKTVSLEAWEGGSGSLSQSALFFAALLTPYDHICSLFLL